MENQQEAKTQPLEELRTAVLRLTAFPDPSENIGEPSWWSDIVGTTPENKTSRPLKGEYQVDGNVGEGRLVLTIQANRVDWNYVPRQDDVSQSQNWIGPFPDCLILFRELTSKWFPLCPKITRLAFGAVLFSPVVDRATGYKRLSAYLPTVQLDPEGSSDFSYRINRPRNSCTGIPGLRINRLSRWAITTFETFTIAVAPSTPSPLKPVEREFAARIEVDINTSPDFGTILPQEKVQDIFEELVGMGMEVIKEGDKK